MLLTDPSRSLDTVFAVSSTHELVCAYEPKLHVSLFTPTKGSAPLSRILEAGFYAECSKEILLCYDAQWAIHCRFMVENSDRGYVSGIQIHGVDERPKLDQKCVRLKFGHSCSLRIEFKARVE